MRLISTVRFLLLLLLPALCLAQSVKIKGKVTDAETGEAMAFVSVYILNSDIGASTDFEGFYTLTLNGNFDSLTAYNMGYAKRTKVILKGQPELIINFQLQPELASLEEIVVRPTENPAFAIMRKVMIHKPRNDVRKLDAYEYETYNRLEVSIDNISDKLKKRKVYKQLAGVYDSSKAIAGEDGKALIPMFISESISNFYHRASPEKTKEVVQAVKVTGVGVTDGSLVSQLVGSSFQNYNFYKNWVPIIQVEILSPIADSWQSFYEYELEDSMYLDSKWCYKLSFKPKHEKDLAFTGLMWIHDSTFAIKQIDVRIGKEVNINFIEKIKIQQESEMVRDSVWLPVKTRAMLDIDELSKNTPGLIAKFYSSSDKIKIGEPKDEKFYDQLIEVKEDAMVQDADYWVNMRKDSITESEKNMYNMIDSIKNVPMIKSNIEIANILINGYKKVGKVDIGPYLFMYSKNNIEGSRFRLGFKTNIDFSRKWVVKGFGAYGTKDQKWKYGASVAYIFSKKRWTEVGIEYKRDLEIISVNEDRLANNALFLMYTHWGTLVGPYYKDLAQLYIQREVRKDLNLKARLKTWDFNAAYPFVYYPEIQNGDTTVTSNYFTTTEVITEARFTKDEQLLQNDNERISLGTKGWPIFLLQYTYGVKGFLGGDFEYHKVNLFINQSIRLGALGRSDYSFTAGKIFTPLPYPLLEVHIGNQSPFYTTIAYNLMNYFEFVSDQFIGVNYRHHFGGLFFNRVPLIKKLNWRFLVTANAVYGSLSQANIDIIPYSSRQNSTVKSFGELPYVEVGYGIENIFKFLRVDFVHRLTYLDAPNVRKFGVKFSAQFKF